MMMLKEIVVVLASLEENEDDAEDDADVENESAIRFLLGKKRPNFCCCCCCCCCCLVFLDLLATILGNFELLLLSVLVESSKNVHLVLSVVAVRSEDPPVVLVDVDDALLRL